MQSQSYVTIWGKEDSVRVSSRVMEERIQAAVAAGRRNLEIKAFGQHGIGGRLWKTGNETVHVKVEGHSGQRVGSMGLPNTHIEVMGPASDDVGWLNAGSEIVVRGNAGNGVANAMAQGKIFIGGNIGARGMTMTKHNPRFDPPELWVLGSAGDYFAEFMAGGVAVICGVESQRPENILGYRPLVGMVGGKVFFRGSHAGFSQTDAKLKALGDDDWDWLRTNLHIFLDRIGRLELMPALTEREQWQLLVARTPMQKKAAKRLAMQSFRENVWEKDLGPGGLVGDLIHVERNPVALTPTGDLRRFVPSWENGRHKAPCEYTCPSGIPVQDRWRLIREGRVDEAVDLALAYTPFPASVCGYLCPNLCMQACTRQSASMAAVDVTQLGRASLKAGLPELALENECKVAVIGGGPSGISVAWQLRLSGFRVTLYDRADSLGGKITSLIPRSRIPAEVVATEIDRIEQLITHVHLRQPLQREDWTQLKRDFDFSVIATGTQNPRLLPVAGHEHLIAASEFLAQARADRAQPGEIVAVIGAGNVGCDVAAEAHRLGARDITLIDVQEPASFGREREAAEAVGAKFRWPCFAQEITAAGVKLEDEEMILADSVYLAIGDLPDLNWLPPEVETEQGFIQVNAYYQTSDPQIFAIGDAVRPGLLTDAIGAGRKAAAAIEALCAKRQPGADSRSMLPQERVSLEYFDPRISALQDLEQCAAACVSCGACRDCGICVEICPENAIRKVTKEDDVYEYVADDTRCIGCGFCAGACPSGVWNLVQNIPMQG